MATKRSPGGSDKPAPKSKRSAPASYFKRGGIRLEGSKEETRKSQSKKASK